MHITPAMLEAAYEYLKTTPPFEKWALPDADDIEFHVGRSRSTSGLMQELPGGKFRVTISSHFVVRSHTLLEVMAHEMCHIKQGHNCKGRPGSYGHGRDFQKMKRIICREHGFDVGFF